ncbi:hypothetical protein [Pedococcus sp. 5OH_020]|uniref:hypothetical protein n=1 Tax=Pedococcus sp. 5OH_020 TaxID=2989814 RepID=UPI0022E9C41E|nr:hypothetical protein [Pedococcus sp. 5OH_020]
MSWLRFDDDFTEWQEWDRAHVEARWAYICLVQACSRGKYWDGRLPKARAIAALAAQVDDPQQCIERLAILSLVHEVRSERVVELPRIHEHVPAPHIRNAKEQTKMRMRRKRAHDTGDHSLCTSGRCSEVGSVTPLVTRHIGTGRDGTGKALPPNAEGAS